MNKSNFQFSRPFLRELSFKENEAFKQNNDSRNIVLRNFLSLNIKKDANESFALVELALEVKAVNEEEGPFHIKARIAAVFKWDPNMNQQIDKMLKINAPALLLSYLRPIVSQSTSYTMFPSYDIPFINFTDGDIKVKYE